MEYYQCAREIDENTDIRDVLRFGQLAELSDPRKVLGTSILHKCYMQLGMYNKAEDIIKDLADRVPDQDLSIKIFHSLYVIGLGDYQKGFTLREGYVSQVPMLRRTPTPPPEHVQHKKWIGQHLADKTLVVWTEFGLGDEIMFAQLAYYLKTRGVKKLIFVVQDPIVSLIETHPDIDEVVPSSQLETLSGDSYDYWVFPHAIPMFMQEPFQLIPKRHPYLSVSKKEVQEKTALFPNTDRLKVGIVWRGDPSHENDYFRSVHELNYIEDLLQTENVDWYCIQKNCNEEEIALLHKYNVPHITKDFNFMETAAALKHLDYLITVDTSVAHVTGALNVPTLLMLSYVSDWRWGYFNEKTNLWYPSISSYYNSSPSANWSNVIKQLKIDLTKFSKRE